MQHPSLPLLHPLFAASTVGFLQWSSVCHPHECGPIPGHRPCCQCHAVEETSSRDHSQHHRLDNISHSGCSPGDFCLLGVRWGLQQHPVSAAVPDWEPADMEEAAKLQRKHRWPVCVPPHHGLLLCEHPHGAVKVAELQKGPSRQADLRHRVRVPGLLGALQRHNFPPDAAAARVLWHVRSLEKHQPVLEVHWDHCNVSLLLKPRHLCTCGREVQEFAAHSAEQMPRTSSEPTWEQRHHRQRDVKYTFKIRLLTPCFSVIFQSCL